MQTKVLDLLGVLVPAILAACHLADVRERERYYPPLQAKICHPLFNRPNHYTYHNHNWCFIFQCRQDKLAGLFVD